MNNRTHFRNETGAFFTKLECQLAYALVLYVRTRRHRHDHSQPPTLEMMNGILRQARRSIWVAAHHRRIPCNPMHPDEYLDAYCLVRNVAGNPDYGEWYDEVRNDPWFWSDQAIELFNRWVSTSCPLVQKYALPILVVFSIRP